MVTVAIALGLATPTAATPATSNAAQTDSAQSLDALIAAEVQKIFRRGPKLENWSTGGIDLEALIAARPGGATRNYLLSVDKEGEPTVTIFDAASAAPFVPAAWKQVASAGSGDAQAGPSSVAIAEVEKGYFLAGVSGHRKVGTAYCSAGNMSVQVYVDPKQPPNEEIPPEALALILDVVVRQFGNRSLCWRFDADGAGYKVTYLHEDGSLLPEFNADEERITIVPAADIATLLKAATR